MKNKEITTEIAKAEDQIFQLQQRIITLQKFQCFNVILKRKASWGKIIKRK